MEEARASIASVVSGPYGGAGYYQRGAQLTTFLPDGNIAGSPARRRRTS